MFYKKKLRLSKYGLSPNSAGEAGTKGRGARIQFHLFFSMLCFTLHFIKDYLNTAVLWRSRIASYFFVDNPKYIE